MRLLESGIRFVMVVERPVDLRRLDEANSVFVLQLPEGIRTAMGSRGASGRSLLKVYRFSCGAGECRLVGETEDEVLLASLDLPYHATALGVIMPDGGEKLVAGVVDPELTSSYSRALGKG